jgi:hypothetical protein
MCVFISILLDIADMSMCILTDGKQITSSVQLPARCLNAFTTLKILVSRE